MKKTINVIVLILLLGGILYCDSYIQVISESGIKVFLDGAFKGETNSSEEGLIIDGVSAGRHKIKLVRTGFIEQEEEISIKSGEVFSYTVKPFIPKLKITQSGEGQGNNIVQKSGTLKIQSIPVAINIKISRLGIDNAKEKDEWLAESVPIGKYNAIFTRNNDKLEYQVEIQENETTHLMVNMFAGKVEVIKKEIAKPKGIKQNQKSDSKNSYGIYGKTPKTSILCDKPPRKLNEAPLRYPKFAKESGIQGTVILEIEVLRDGKVGAIEVKKSVLPGPGGLDEAAIEYARKLKFSSAKIGSKPVAVWITFPVNFYLQ